MSSFLTVRSLSPHHPWLRACPCGAIQISQKLVPSPFRFRTNTTHCFSRCESSETTVRSLKVYKLSQDAAGCFSQSHWRMHAHLLFADSCLCHLQPGMHYLRGCRMMYGGLLFRCATQSCALLMTLKIAAMAGCALKRSAVAKRYSSASTLHLHYLWQPRLFLSILPES